MIFSLSELNMLPEVAWSVSDRIRAPIWALRHPAQQLCPMAPASPAGHPRLDTARTHWTLDLSLGTLLLKWNIVSHPGSVDKPLIHTLDHHLYPLMPLVTSWELNSLKRTAIDSLISFKMWCSCNSADTESVNENPTWIWRCHKSLTTGELLKSTPFNVLVHSFTDHLGSYLGNTPNRIRTEISVLPESWPPGPRSGPTKG